MAQFAARITDPTVHGGTIAMGCPTVLIGGLPAARLGDLHMCPISVPPTPPHVGGPVNQGSASVTILGQPAARMGDMAICTGPPDVIIMGCPTVLIGGPTVTMVAIGGAGGGGGGGSTSTSSEAQSIQDELDDIDDQLSRNEAEIELNERIARAAPGAGLDPPRQGEAWWQFVIRVMGETGGGLDPAPDWAEPLGGDMVRHGVEEENDRLRRESDDLRERRRQLQDRLDEIHGGTDDEMIG